MKSVVVGAITLFVQDLGVARAFYSNAFGLPAVFEDEHSAVFKFENTLVNLLVAREASGLIEPANVGVAGDGAHFMLSVWVDDVDAVCSELGARGVTLLNGPIDRAWGKRTASFVDPDGTIWEIAQELAPKAGS